MAYTLISPCVVEATATHVSLPLSSLSPSYFSMCCISYCHSCFPPSLSSLSPSYFSMCCISYCHSCFPPSLSYLSPSYFSTCCISYCHSCFPLSILSITQLFLLVLWKILSLMFPSFYSLYHTSREGAFAGLPCKDPLTHSTSFKVHRAKRWILWLLKHKEPSVLK